MLVLNHRNLMFFICHSILSVMIHLLFCTLLAHLLQHVVSYGKFATAYYHLWYICNSTLSIMIHCYSVLSVMIYLLQLTVSCDTYSTLSVMGHLSQHTVNYDTFITAYCQLRWTCHSVPSGMIHLCGDHPDMLQTEWVFKKNQHSLWNLIELLVIFSYYFRSVW
jgi:hypothetical protein